MPVVNLKPSPVREEVEREKQQEEQMEQSFEGLTLLSHACGFGLFSEVAELSNAPTASRRRRQQDEEDQINIDPRARLNPSKSFMPR